MKNTLLQILGFALMVIGIQGAIRLLANGDPGLLAGLHVDNSLLIAINVIAASGGIYLLTCAQKRSKR